MDTEHLKKVYENTLKNSVGREKQCVFKKYVKKVIFKVAISILIIFFILSTFCGCNLNMNQRISQDIIEDEENEYNGYSIYELSLYSSDRAQRLLDSYGFDNYTVEGVKRNYHYTAEDYKKINELDETYLYGMYLNTTDETLVQILNALGYEHLEDFLLKNDYVYDGKANIFEWGEANLEIISEIKAAEEKGVGLK